MTTNIKFQENIQGSYINSHFIYLFYIAYQIFSAGDESYLLFNYEESPAS